MGRADGARLKGARVVIVDYVQRHRDGAPRWRPAREVVDLRRIEVAGIARDVARSFVERHHYAHSYPAGRFAFGLFQAGALSGVAVFSQPVNDLSTACLPGERLERVELGRFVLLDHVGANAETWLLARCFEELRRAGLSGVVSFSDPVPRQTATGHLVMPGHVGIIYQAHNAVYLGRSKAERRRLLPDGTVVHNRALAKIRNGERGCRTAVESLVSHGARPPRRDEDLRGWLSRELPRITRSVPHCGNHKYAWTLRRRDRRHLQRYLERQVGHAIPYPKVVDTLAPLSLFKCRGSAAARVQGRRPLP